MIDTSGMENLTAREVYSDMGAYSHSIMAKIPGFEKLKEDDEFRHEISKLGEQVDQLIVKMLHKHNPEVEAHAKQTRAEIMALFPCPIFVEEIPNGYCSRGCCAYYPWFIVTTPIGRIKIGWRKSVMHLEWTDTVVKTKADDLFPDEGIVTRYDQVIHCWGYDKARTYIAKLLEVGEAK